VGADYIQFRPFWGGAVPIDAELRLCRNLETDRFRVLSAAQKYGRLDAPRNYATCHGSALAAVIQADGNVPLCCNLRGRPDWYLGNALEQPFRRIWDGPARARLLERLCVSQCVPLCRLDAINGVLEDLVTPKQHEEFL
jgi:MoaA/NifB/PqqE/SkfB family radical SAM enzyme